MSLVRVTVISDDPLFAEGLRRILAAEASLGLVQLDRGPARSPLRVAAPLVVLLDYRTKDRLRLCQDLNRQGARVLMLEIPDGEAAALEAIHAGARGLLGRSASAEEVVKAVGLVHQGGVWAPRQVLVAALTRRVTAAADDERAMPAGAWGHLSAREREVLALAAIGLANKEVADRLDISEATVKTHLTHIFQKVGVRSRTELAAAYYGIAPRTVIPPNVVRLKAN
ncbi:MAG: response regulator transcription factor [Acidobacteriia bacterium]|nr:response regulator transcription factor [Terriglobia bacterium]